MNLKAAYKRMEREARKIERHIDESRALRGQPPLYPANKDLKIHPVRKRQPLTEQ